MESLMSVCVLNGGMLAIGTFLSEVMEISVCLCPGLWSGASGLLLSMGIEGGAPYLPWAGIYHPRLLCHLWWQVGDVPCMPWASATGTFQSVVRADCVVHLSKPRASCHWRLKGDMLHTKMLVFASGLMPICKQSPLEIRTLMCEPEYSSDFLRGPSSVPASLVKINTLWVGVSLSGQSNTIMCPFSGKSRKKWDQTVLREALG